MNKDAGYICAECAENGETCCSLGPAAPGGAGPDSGEECFPLSEAEIGRIRRALDSDPSVAEGLQALPGTGMPEDVFALERNGPVFLKAIRAMFPGESAAVSRVFEPGGVHWRMALPDGRRCVFLGSRGCLLECGDRPWFCRIYPFWRVRLSTRCFANDACLALRRASDLAGLLALFGVNEEDLNDLYLRLRLDWGLGAGSR